MKTKLTRPYTEKNGKFVYKMSAMTWSKFFELLYKASEDLSEFQREVLAGLYTKHMITRRASTLSLNIQQAYAWYHIANAYEDEYSVILNHFRLALHQFLTGKGHQDLK